MFCSLCYVHPCITMRISLPSIPAHPVITLQGLCQEGGRVQRSCCYPAAKQGCAVPTATRRRRAGYAVPQCSQDQQKVGMQPVGGHLSACRALSGACKWILRVNSISEGHFLSPSGAVSWPTRVPCRMVISYGTCKLCYVMPCNPMHTCQCASYPAIICCMCRRNACSCMTLRAPWCVSGSWMQ